MRQAWFRKKMTFQEVLKPNVTRKITLCSSCMHTSWTIYTPTNWQRASISDMHVHADAPTSEWKHLKEAEIDHYLAHHPTNHGKENSENTDTTDADCAKALFTERLTDQSREISNSLEYANARAPINFHSSTPFNMNELYNPSFW